MKQILLSWQCQINMKKIILFLILVCLIQIISAAQLKLSPTYLNLNGNVNEKICGNVEIYSSFEGFLISDTKWSEIKSKDIKKYKRSSLDSNIETYFSDKIKVVNSKNNEIFCFVFKKGGDYYGALILSSEDKLFGIGIWIDAKIYGGNNTEEKIKDMGEEKISLTGKVIDDSNENSNNSLKIKLMGVLSAINLSYLLFLLFVKRKA